MFSAIRALVYWAVWGVSRVDHESGLDDAEEWCVEGMVRMLTGVRSS